MITAIALDDDIASLEIIETFCSNLDGICLQKTFLKTIEAREYLEKNPVDLLFLDVNLSSKTGFDFYKSLSGIQQTSVIFITAFKDYAVDSYDVGAVDFLLKPFNFSRFSLAVERVIERKKLLHQSNEEPLFFKADYGLVKIVSKEILYIEGHDNYVKIFLQNQKPMMIRMTLKEILEKIPEKYFLRIHRSTIVSLPQITAFKNKTAYINEIALSVGNTYEKDFVEKLKKQALFHP